MAKILVISEDLWYPPDAGDSLRQFHLLRNLSDKHEFVWCCRYRRERTNDEKALGANFARAEGLLIPRPSIWRKIIKAIPRLILGQPIRQAAHIYKQVWERVNYLTSNEHFDIVQIEHTKMAEYVKAIAPSCKALKILTVQNLAHIFYKRMSGSHDGLLKYYYLYESKLYRTYEEDLLRYFDAFITVSDENMDWLKKCGFKGNLLLARNGINVEGLPFLPQRKEPNIMFVGSMDYPPNIHAVIYFIKEVFPEILTKIPESKFYIVGRNPVNQIRELADNKRIFVSGTVKDTIPYYEKAALTVVPLQIGAGTRLKIIESMALGRVVISSTIGAEGLIYRNQENILIADNPKETTELILKVLQDTDFRQKIADNARRHVESNYNINQIAKGLNKFYSKLLN